jgi:gluconokinase
VLEGILFEIYSIGKTLEEHCAFNSLSINGSFASIPLCAQIIADMFNMPVSISQHNYSVGIGAYLLSATEMGIYKNIDEAAKSIVVPEQYFPKKNVHGIYMQHFEIFEKLIFRLKDDFANVVKLQ